MDGTGSAPRPGVMNRFEPGSPADVAALTRGQILGLVICGPFVTPLPLLTETDAAGAVTGFFGHFALSNPQVEALKADPRALIVFQGPHAYVPPAWVSDPTWAPTWNYALASFEVELTFDASENERSIIELSLALEGDRWTPAEMGARFAPMLTRILAQLELGLAPHDPCPEGQDAGQHGGEARAHLGRSPAVALKRARQLDDRPLVLRRVKDQFDLEAGQGVVPGRGPGRVRHPGGRHIGVRPLEDDQGARVGHQRLDLRIAQREMAEEAGDRAALIRLGQQRQGRNERPGDHQAQHLAARQGGDVGRRSRLEPVHDARARSRAGSVHRCIPHSTRPALRSEQTTAHIQL
ncbi:MAG: hypothetical protein EON88_14270 [Brevundimonas sp.]|nr:MAG: hypothetical protein EON88_14270 [Brevundimonas sp.]